MRFDIFETVLPPDLGAGAFKPGLNTITFMLINVASFTPVSLRFEADVTAAPVPEPVGPSLLIAAAALAARRGRRRPL